MIPCYMVEISGNKNNLSIYKYKREEILHIFVEYAGLKWSNNKNEYL